MNNCFKYLSGFLSSLQVNFYKKVCIVSMVITYVIITRKVTENKINQSNDICNTIIILLHFLPLILTCI